MACSAASIPSVDRFYRQRLPTPGYDAFTDARFGAGTRRRWRNGFPANSPYNADLPYDIRQTAVFGEATYDITPALHVTAGGRYYDFEEERRFKSGGLFSNGDNNTDQTTSNGFSPRVIAELRGRPTMSASTPRPRRASGSAASTIRSTCRCARRRDGSTR